MYLDLAIFIPRKSQYDESVNMRKPIHITAPRPTREETEKHLRIPKARKKELQLLVDAFKAQLSREDQALVNRSGPEEGRKSASAA